MSEKVYVKEFPRCDLCRYQDGEVREARYDGATTFGPWAYMCEHHFQKFGQGLGTGRGQRLVVRDADSG